MTAVFVDTNVLLYREDGADRVKQLRALDWLRALWFKRSGRVSTQVLNELYASATRKLNPSMPQGDARAEVRRYQRWQPWLVDHATVEIAWSVQRRFDVSYWNALIVAAAQAQSCRYLLTEDMHHLQVMDQLQIINPFLVGPDVLDSAHG